MPLVVGATRSGATLLRRLLDGHRQIAMPPETCFPAGVFESAPVESGEAIAARVVAAPTWSDLRLDPEAYQSRCRGRQGVEALRLVWSLYGEIQGKPIVGDASPEYVHLVPSIARAIPDLRVIHLIRDGRDCFAAQRHSRCSLRSSVIHTPATQATRWREAVLAGRSAGAAVAEHAGRALELRYEDLILETERELRRVCAFLGVDFDPGMLDHAARAERRLSEPGARTAEEVHPQSGATRRLAFAPTASAPDSLRIGRWQETLLDDEVAAFESVAGPLLVECGYALSSTVLASRDEETSGMHAARSATALERRDYDAAEREAILAFRSDPTSLRRITSLFRLAAWTDDLPVYWRMGAARTKYLPRRFDGRLPAWRGEPLDADGRLFIASPERHLGFNLRMSSILTTLGDLAPHCTLAVEPRLMPLIRRRVPSVELVPLGSDPPVEARYGATWELLGHYLLPSMAAMPGTPWIEPDPARVKSFARRDPTKPRVAFLWNSTNARKQLPSPVVWRHLLSIPGVEWVSVQHDLDAREVPEWQDLRDRIVVEDFDLRDDLDGLSALLRSCDLLTGISGSAMHLAGALHVPTWMLAREIPQLFWPLGRERTPWYPAMRCLWVEEQDDWERRVLELSDEVGRWASAFRRKTTETEGRAHG